MSIRVSAFSGTKAPARSSDTPTRADPQEVVDPELPVMIPEDDAVAKAVLSDEEDDELRRLYFLSLIGMNLSESNRLRLLELRIRDRREKVRPPRELAQVDSQLSHLRPWLAGDPRIA